MKILGIDPGSTRIGYGVIDAAGSRLSLVTHGTLEIAAAGASDRLHELEARFTALLAQHAIARAGVETLFFSKNKKTALAVAQSRGVILLCLRQHGIPLYECAPATVKQAVTGYGKADKRAVLKMITAILGAGAGQSRHDDASDALAVAIATAFQTDRAIHSETS